MNQSRPYIICHMMASLDGRIDCAMTSKLAGVEEYYQALAALDLPTTISGKTTAKMELTAAPDFAGEIGAPIGQETFYLAEMAAGYSVVTDTRGTLGWDTSIVDGKPLLILMSEQAGVGYLTYLKEKGISYITCGKERIDLARAAKLLYKEFHVERLGIVGGGTINAAFLAARLLDEISLLYAPGIDGRAHMKAAFDGLPMDEEPFHLKLKSVQPYQNGAIWLRYTI